MKIKNSQINEKGSALIVALFFVAILTVIGLALLFNTSLDNVISNNYAKTVRATYTATSGIERFKAYLLYDYKHDPAGWSNQYIVVPQGTTYADGTLAPPASGINASGSDAYLDLDFVGNTATIPSTTPYKINPNIRYAVDPTLYAEVAATPGNPITPGSGYQIMLRNLANVQGGTCSSPSDCDPNSIFVLGIGRTTATKAYLGSDSRGMNLIEDGIFGDDISVWNNIFFAEDNTLSGGGNMTIHGNVHTLGPNPPPLVSTTTFVTKASVVNSYYTDKCPNQCLKDPLKSTLSVPQQRHDDDGKLPYFATDPKNNLHAKFRVRNGLVNLQATSYIGQPASTGILFDVIATCRNCPSGNNNGFTTATPEAYGAKFKNYNVPANLQSLIKVPLLADEYKDPSTLIIYPTYTDYFIGMHSFGGTNYDLPGTLGLKLATALGNDNTMTMDSTLVSPIWNAKDAIFAQNVQNQAGTVSQEQQTLDPVGEGGETDPLFSPIIGSGPSDGKTFMIVAADDTNHVVMVYKEVAPFTRSVDSDLTGAAGAADVDFPRVIHGFILAPSNASMAGLTLKVEIDGANIDGATGDGLDWIYDTTDPCHSLPTPPASCQNTLNSTQSNQLVRKVANALWKASRGECGILGACFNSVAKDTWEASMAYNNGAASRIYDTGTNNLKITLTAPEDKDGKLIAFGAIETTDTLDLAGFLFAGRFTLFARDSNGAGAGVGRVNFTDNVYAIGSYQYPTGSSPATYVAFPCQNNMGIMTSEDIDHSSSPHDDFEGAFYAGNLIHLTKQEQIVGAMVAKGWQFGAGGNPDFFQAMEISRCLPPYIIAKDVIVFADSVSWLER